MKIFDFRFQILTGLIAVSALGADVTMTVNPPIISLGEAAQLQIKISDAKKYSTPTIPTIEGLRITPPKIPSISRRTVNGKLVENSVSYTFSISPQRIGEFQIGPFKYSVDGETRQLTGKLKVVSSNGDLSSAKSWNEMVFSKITSNRKTPYVQEPFELTLSIYSRVGLEIQRVENLQGLPETGLTTETQWVGISPTRENINGQLYEVRSYKATLRAIKSGQFNFSPSVTVQVISPRQQQNDPFGFAPFFNRIQTIPVAITAEPLSVEVLSLPTIGKPDHFTGAVGQFQFHVTADPKEVSPGDPITLQMTILGEGNYDRILPPTLPADAPFRLFGDAVRQQGNNGVRFEQVVSPRDVTVTEIPPLEFSFFDTDSGTYRTLSSDPIPITVNASSNNTAQLFAAQESIQTAPADTPFATESDVQRITGWLTQKWKIIRPWLWTLPAALGIGTFLFLLQKIHHWRRKDTARIRRQQAPKAARQGLKAANQALHKKDPSAFYEALGKALSDYFGHRLNLPPGDVTSATVIAALEQAGLETDTLRSVFEQVEAARYGMGTKESLDEMKSLKIRLEQIFRLAEKTNL